MPPFSFLHAWLQKKMRAQQSPALERDALAFAGFEMYKLSYAGVLKYSRDFTCVKRYTLVFAVV